MQCPICLHPGPFPTERVCSCAFSGERLVRSECRQCGVVFGTERMLRLTPAELASEYDQLYRSGHVETDSTNVELSLLDRLSPTTDKVYLNWGAGDVGRSSELAAQRGLRLYGYDPYVLKRGPWLLTRIDQLATYDGIISNNMLEHLQDPVGTLRIMRQHLKPGAIMLHKTPCYEYLYDFSKYHLFFYLGYSAEILAGRAGLACHRTEDPWLLRYEPVD